MKRVFVMDSDAFENLRTILQQQTKHHSLDSQVRHQIKYGLGNVTEITTEVRQVCRGAQNSDLDLYELVGGLQEAVHFDERAPDEEGMPVETAKTGRAA